MPLQTPFTKKLSLSHPLVLAPMGGVADGTLAGATAATGGLGFIALSPYKAGWLESELKKAGHIAGEKGALGVGWITWYFSAGGISVTRRVDVFAY